MGLAASVQGSGFKAFGNRLLFQGSDYLGFVMWFTSRLGFRWGLALLQALPAG